MDRDFIGGHVCAVAWQTHAEPLEDGPHLCGIRFGPVLLFEPWTH
jgi:hypothetical protein